MVRFLDLISSRLLWLNIGLVVLIKVIIPFGFGGLANIGETLERIDVGAVIQRTNVVRQNNGLESLQTDPALQTAAEERLGDMARRGYFSHISPDGRWAWDFIRDAGYTYRYAGENLARGFYDPERLVSAWMASDAHRGNLLNTNYTDIGIAAAQVTIGGRYTLVVVQLFASPGTPGVAYDASTPDYISLVFDATGVQAISTDAGVMYAQRELSAAAFEGDVVDRVGDAAEKGMGIWLVLLVSVLSSVAIIQRRFKLLIPAGAHLALLMVLTMAPSLRAFTGTIF